LKRDDLSGPAFPTPDDVREDGSFRRLTDEPILGPDWLRWYETLAAYQPAVIRDGGRYALLYRAEAEGTDCNVSRIGLAESDDGVHFHRHGDRPVISINARDDLGYTARGAYDELGRHHAAQIGVEDPRVVRIGDWYYVTYTEIPPDGSDYWVGWSRSRNLVDWEYLGRMLPGLQHCKAGAMLDAPVDGTWFMYVGFEAKTSIAYSEDLKTWKLGKIGVLNPRPGRWDNINTEPGTPPRLIDGVIVMIYGGETRFADHPWRDCTSAGVAVFDAKDPSRLVARSARPILSPVLFWERHGRPKTPDVIWPSSLVKVDGGWNLYYGAADRYCGVAFSPDPARFWVCR
jgi:predicted GH43/DUF377 family glycosyl hydrolase